jgi:hypothetical protein
MGHCHANEIVIRHLTGTGFARSFATPPCTRLLDRAIDRLPRTDALEREFTQ